ncbi:hypothetical protein KAR91_77645 [Candidatus Pacearchaeota archaeon]|nr:hypothetical protein [Candidatus Pacearchaeota archaeon]
MKTYPAMNKEIVGLLRISKRPHHLYAAQRIEELESITEELYQALVDYEMDSEGEAPIKHRKMMLKANKLLPNKGQ